MQARWKGLGLSAVVGIAFLVALSGGAVATGSGYNQSYTESAGHSSNSAVDLVATSSSYTSGPNLSVSLTVSGDINYANSSYVYEIWFDGTLSTNATAYAVFTDGTAGYLGGADHSGFGLLFPVISGGTLSFSVATAVVGSSTGFFFDAFALYGASKTTGTFTWLGANYTGGVTCTGTGCTTTSGTTSTFDWWIVIIPVIVIVVIVVIVLALVMRKKPPAQPAMMGQPGQPMGQPDQPAWGAPPAGQPNWPTPPSSPPPGVQ
ncbi:MAG: hypothetical protein WB789_07300 [Thermoplasmata archaeon]